MIRAMKTADLPAAMRLKEAAGWNQTEADWRAVLELEPDGCWVFEVDGVAAGSTTVVRYGRELAWIGMVLTLPEYRRRGIARALMEHALADCQAHGIGCVKLDATDLGRPLYAALGFRDEQPIERWSGQSPQGRARAKSGRTSTLRVPAALDRRAFGADRRPVLDGFLGRGPDDAAASETGFVMTRPGSEAHFLGPCVAESAAAADELVEGALARYPGEPFYWDLLPANPAAVEAARRLSFAPKRRLMRMSWGGEVSDDPGLVWATAGFEYG